MKDVSDMTRMELVGEIITISEGLSPHNFELIKELYAPRNQKDIEYEVLLKEEMRMGQLRALYRQIHNTHMRHLDEL